MKIIHTIKIFALITMIAWMAGSCKKSWLDVNYNPSELTDSAATPDLVLPVLLAEWPGTFQSGFNDWMGYWCEPRLSEGSIDWTNYNFNGTFWMDDPTLGQFLFEEKAARVNQTFYVGIAKIIKALTYSRNVDVLNNLPYTDAFKVNVRYPTYDDGQFIYEELMKELDLAISLIRDADVAKNAGISKADIMFHADKDKWIKFANTLKLRLLVHQANVPGRDAYIQSEISKIVNEGSGFLNSGEDAALNPGYTWERPNAFYERYTQFETYNTYWPPQWPSASANVTALNFLKENDDPRIDFFYAPVQTPLPAGASEPFSQPEPLTYRGNKFGLPLNEATYPYQGTAYVSHVGGITEDGVVTSQSTGILKGYNMDFWIITSVESLFLQAEAVYRGWLPGNAEQAYKDAVKESFRWLNAGGNSDMPELSDAVFEEWYNNQVAASNVNVSWQAAPDKYKLLMFQKYMAFNGIEPFESYVDYRRNGGYPDIPLSADPARIGDKLPVRSLYNSNEYVNNAANVKAQGTIDVFNSKIWWMP